MPALHGGIPSPPPWPGCPQLLEDTGAPSPILWGAPESEGQLRGSASRRGKGWSSQTTLPVEAWRVRRWFYTPQSQGLGARDPRRHSGLQETWLTEGGTGCRVCWGHSESALSVFWVLGSPSLSFLSGKKKQSGWICADLFP